jgi:hypothetical protein
MPLSRQLWGVLTLVTPRLTSPGIAGACMPRRTPPWACLPWSPPGLRALKDVSLEPLRITLTVSTLKPQAYTPPRRALRRAYPRHR